MSRNNATWSPERVTALKRGFDAGLSCSRIAREIGVTRNAVIGKMNRLGLTRPKDVLARQQRREPRPPRPRIFKSWRTPCQSIGAQQALLRVVFPKPEPYVEEVIVNGRGCTLLELGHEKCRWPISTPGAEDFCFCGNAPVKGLPYCPGHARMAYRPAGRARIA